MRPLEPLALPENHLVRLTLDDQPSTKGDVAPIASSPVNSRREELEWLTKESGKYAGQWVALDGGRLVAHGDDLSSVSAAARAAGVDRPF